MWVERILERLKKSLEEEGSDNFEKKRERFEKFSEQARRAKSPEQLHAATLGIRKLIQGVN